MFCLFCVRQWTLTAMISNTACCGLEQMVRCSHNMALGGASRVHLLSYFKTTRLVTDVNIFAYLKWHLLTRRFHAD